MYDEKIDINTLLSVICFPILKIDKENEKLMVPFKKPPMTLGVIQTCFSKKLKFYKKPELLLGVDNMFYKNIAKEALFRKFSIFV